jgi:hypothetical protein
MYPSAEVCGHIRVLAMVCLIEALVALLPIGYIITPTPDKPNMGSDIALGLSSLATHIPATFFAVFQFVPQFGATRALALSGRAPEALSIWTLLLQVPVFVLLGVSCWSRFERLEIPDEPFPMDGYYWYVVAGWSVVNCVIMACGQAVLFAVIIFQRKRPVEGSGIRRVDETTRLLGWL